MKRIEGSSSNGLIPGQKSYAQIMNRQVLPLLDNLAELPLLLTTDGRKLYCATYPAENPRGTVLLLHGFTENTLKYSELIYSLLYSGYSVAAYDQRGHGRSWRDPEVHPSSVTHVDRIDDYVQDLDLVVRTILKDMPKPWFLFAHSMGGAVAVLYLENMTPVFNRVVLCAPMIAPNLSGLSPKAACRICRIARCIHHEKRHPFFMKPYSGPEDFQSSNATDENRFAWYDSIKAARNEFQNTVPSYQWIMEAVRVTETILTPGKPERIRCPILLYTAALDTTVLPGPQEAFIRRVPKGKQVLVQGARHEIYRSADDVFFPWWQSVLDFFSQENDKKEPGDFS